MIKIANPRRILISCCLIIGRKTLRFRLEMDERVHVPIDDPNADTEWQVFSYIQVSSVAKISTGMTFFVNMALSLRNLHPLLPLFKKLSWKLEDKPTKIG